MEERATPNYVLRANEIVEIPKKKEKTSSNLLWWIISIIILFFVSLNLLLYQSISGLGSIIGLSILYVRFTYPRIRKKSNIVIWSIISFILLVSVYLEVNFLPWPVLIIVIPLFLWASFSREHDKVLFPLEMQFYDDYFILYREKTYILWFTKYLAKEYFKMFYKDVTLAEFVKYPNGVLRFNGKVEVLRYKYNKDGTVNEEPVFHKILDDSFSYIYTNGSPEIDFVTEIESRSPIRIKRNEYTKYPKAE